MKGAGYACTLILVATMSPTTVGAEVLFPAAVQGWILAPLPESYTPENLYRYIDGASELYLSYGFVSLLSCRYQRQGQPEIVVDFFDMGSPGNAFGIFAHSQEKPEQTIGQDSEYLDGLLRFWKGRYYVSLLAAEVTAEAQTAVLTLGRSLAAAIPESGLRPRLLGALPDQGLVTASIRYFNHPAWQNSYVFIAAENILEIGPDCQAVLAKYEHERERPIVLLVLYADVATAQRAFAALRGKFLLPAAEDKAVKLAGERYLAAGLEKKALIAVWHVAGAAPALQLLSLLREKIAAFMKPIDPGGNP